MKGFPLAFALLLLLPSFVSASTQELVINGNFEAGIQPWIIHDYPRGGARLVLYSASPGGFSLQTWVGGAAGQPGSPPLPPYDRYGVVVSQLIDRSGLSWDLSYKFSVYPYATGLSYVTIKTTLVFTLEDPAGKRFTVDANYHVAWTGETANAANRLPGHLDFFVYAAPHAWAGFEVNPKTDISSVIPDLTEAKIESIEVRLVTTLDPGNFGPTYVYANWDDISLSTQAPGKLAVTSVTASEQAESSAILNVEISNQGDEDVKDVQVRLQLPPGMTSEFSLLQQVGTLQPSETKQLSWILRAEKAGTYALTIKASSENGGTLTNSSVVAIAAQSSTDHPATTQRSSSSIPSLAPYLLAPVLAGAGIASLLLFRRKKPTRSRFCMECGAELASDTRVCQRCGTSSEKVEL